MTMRGKRELFSAGQLRSAVIIQDRKHNILVGKRNASFHNFTKDCTAEAD